MDQKQADKRQRGEDFQNELKRSWPLVANTWRLRIPDKGGSRPADELVIAGDINILAELKRTESEGFQLSYLRPNQLKGLIEFDACNKRNKGLVFISFLSETENRDSSFVFRLTDGLKFMHLKGRNYIRMDELATHKLPALGLRLIEIKIEDKLPERAWDLSEVETYFNKF